MSELLENWIEKELSEVCTKASKINPKDNPDKEITYLYIGGIDNEAMRIADVKTYRGAEAPSKARQLVENGDALFLQSGHI